MTEYRADSQDDKYPKTFLIYCKKCGSEDVEVEADLPYGGGGVELSLWCSECRERELIHNSKH